MPEAVAKLELFFYESATAKVRICEALSGHLSLASDVMD
jgi:hypothetical protein